MLLGGALGRQLSSKLSELMIPPSKTAGWLSGSQEQPREQGKSQVQCPVWPLFPSTKVSYVGTLVKPAAEQACSWETCDGTDSQSNNVPAMNDALNRVWY